MGINVIPAPSAESKTMYRTTLTSGTSYTVPAGVTYLNVTLIGGGAGATNGRASGDINGGTGGTTTFTGATSASGGNGGRSGDVGRSGVTAVRYGDSGTYGSHHDGHVGMRYGLPATSGSIVNSTVSTSPGATISYTIGSGGAGAEGYGSLSGGSGAQGAIIVEYWA